jgi:toxin YoeB
MSKKVTFSQIAWEEYLNWQTQDKRTLKRINQLIQDIQRDSFNGIGKPELLVGDQAGFWSRRIDEKNRLLYKVSELSIEIVQCGNHYDDK